MRFGTRRRQLRLVVPWVVALLAGAAPGAALGAAALHPLAGSPFVGAGGGSGQSVAVSPGGRHLYVSCVGTNDLALFAIAPDGALAFVGRFPSAAVSGLMGGVAFSPAGDRLYAGATGLVGFHLVGPDGELAPPLAYPAQVPHSDPLNGLAYLPLAGGDFLYVNDNDWPNTVSAWRIGPDGAPEFVRAYPTGGYGSGPLYGSLIAAPRIAAFGTRVFVLNAPGQGAPIAPSSISVFDAGPDGALSQVPGSPFDMGERSGSIAIDPSGEFLYAGGGGTASRVLKLRIAPDGALERVAEGTAAGMTGKPNGLAVDPTGRWIAFAAAGGGNAIAVLDTGTLAPIQDGIQPDSGATGVAWDAAGHLFVGHTLSGPVVTAYEVVEPSVPPIATCAGTAERPAVLAADASSCSVAVDAANGLAGTCASAAGGDLASCTLDGQTSLLLGLGPHAVEVVATAPDGASASCTSYVSVVDATPPVVAASPSPALLWPPDHALVPVDPGASARDACDGAVPVSCTALSSEPDDDLGDGSTSPDVLASDGALWLRAERSALGPGRVYTVTCTATDAAGNGADAVGAVLVPHDELP
jgi:DNA-binding beta-propeller fold protein YncE